MKRVGFLLLIVVLAIASAQAAWNLRNVTQILPGEQGPAGTVAWGDVNGDGQLDLFVGGWEGANSRLYLRGENCFINATGEYGVGNVTNVTSARFVDYDHDGLLDLMCLVDAPEGVIVLHQTPHGDYHTVPVSAGTPFDEPVRSAVWTDLDDDGALDLILSNGGGEGSPIGVFIQEEDEFVPLRDGWGPLSGRAGAITLCDEDKDGDLDYFIGGYGASPPRLYRNHEGEYVDEASWYDFPATLGGASAVWFDFNNDRMLDLFVTNPAGMPYLYLGDVREGQRTLKPAPDEIGLRWAYRGVNAHAVDADMDGWTDLFVTSKERQGCTLMRNVQGRYWEEMAVNLGLANPLFQFRDGAWADYDQDGDLDVAIAYGSMGVRLYRSDLKNHNEYVALRLLTRGTNSPAMNCEVIATFDELSVTGGTYQTTSARAQDANIVYLANPHYEAAEEVSLWVRWSNGVQRVYGPEQFVRNGITTLIEPVAEIPEVCAVIGQTAPQPPIIEFGNAPNPFNPTTTISFTLAEASWIELKIFDLTGREVVVPARGEFAAGKHKSVFEASALPSGMYFARLTANSDTRLLRMLLAK